MCGADKLFVEYLNDQRDYILILFFDDPFIVANFATIFIIAG